MKKYVSVLNDVICLDEIKKISIVYNNGTNYGNSLLHSLFVTYKDGTTEKYNTTDCSQAKQDYENLKTVLLGIGIDRKQSEGENIGTLHPVDEFICSECGIVLEGWSRVVTDEDDSDTMFCEYEFKYCPNCGVKMKW